MIMLHMIIMLRVNYILNLFHHGIIAINEYEPACTTNNCTVLGKLWNTYNDLKNES